MSRPSSGVNYQSSFNRNTDRLQAMGDATSEKPFKGQEDELSGATASEATRLLGSINDGSKEESKKQLYTWMWKMALVAIIIIVVITVGTLVIVLVPGQKGNLQSGCVKKFNEEVDYFPFKTEILDDGLLTEYYPHYKVASCSSTTDQYLLYQCGTPLPNGFFRSKKFAVAINSVATTGVNFLGYLELLGALNRIKYLGSYESIVSPCIRKLVESGSLELYSTNREQREIQTNNSDAVFWSLKVQDSLEDKNVYLLPQLEKSMRKRASVWLQFVGLFFNMEKEANELAIKMVSRYDCHKTQAQRFSSQPKVAWISYSAPIWYILKENEKIEIIRDAGGVLLNLTTDSFIRVEEFHEQLLDVDIVIDQSGSTPTWDLFLEKYRMMENDTFPFMQSGQVWRNDKIINTLANSDWEESAFAEPDAILEDLISIFHPEYNTEREKIWFRKLYQNLEESRIPGVELCNDPYKSKKARGTDCSP